MNNYDADDWHVPAPNPDDAWEEAPPYEDHSKDESTWYEPNQETQNNGYGFKDPDIHINPSRINIGLAKVGTFLKNVRDTVGLLPLRIKTGAMAIKNKIETAKVGAIGIKNGIKQKYIAAPIALVKAKVCSVKQNIKNKITAALTAIANVFLPDRQLKAELEEMYKEQKRQYEEAQAEKERLKREGKLDNMINNMEQEMQFEEEESFGRKGGRGIISYSALISLLLLSITVLSIFLAWSIIK